MGGGCARGLMGKIVWEWARRAGRTLKEKSSREPAVPEGKNILPWSLSNERLGAVSNRHKDRQQGDHRPRNRPKRTKSVTCRKGGTTNHRWRDAGSILGLGNTGQPPGKKLMVAPYLRLHPKRNSNQIENLDKLSIWSKSTTGSGKARELQTHFRGGSGLPEPARVGDHVTAHGQHDNSSRNGRVCLLLLWEYSLSNKGKHRSRNLSENSSIRLIHWNSIISKCVIYKSEMLQCTMTVTAIYLTYSYWKLENS